MRWLELERFAYTPFGTFGKLRVREALKEPEDLDGGELVFECFTVEPAWLWNAEGRSCVPVGRYPLVYEYSPKFKRELWELKDIPGGRSEAKLHVANLATQLEGCIAPGLRLGAMDDKWCVLASAVALERLHAALAEQKASYINIRNAPMQGVLARAA
jgi:uncharacterized protein DUF5675